MDNKKFIIKGNRLISIKNYFLKLTSNTMYLGIYMVNLADLLGVCDTYSPADMNLEDFQSLQSYILVQMKKVCPKLLYHESNTVEMLDTEIKALEKITSTALVDFEPIIIGFFNRLALEKPQDIEKINQAKDYIFESLEYCKLSAKKICNLLPKKEKM